MSSDFGQFLIGMLAGGSFLWGAWFMNNLGYEAGMETMCEMDGNFEYWQGKCWVREKLEGMTVSD